MRIAYIFMAGLALAACESGSGGTGTIAIAGGSAATHVVFTVPPTGSASGVVITPAVVVTAAKSSGARDTSFRSLITVTISSGSSGSGLLSGTTQLVASGGIATFGDLKVSAAGTYTLTASAPPLVGITSSPFAITP